MMNAPMIIHILAGGASQRMGVDKRQLLLGGVVLPDWCRMTVESLDCHVHYIKEDFRKGHGPLGGVETGLMHAANAFHLFLSCDMPFVSALTIKDLIAIIQDDQTITCMEGSGKRGFPLGLPGSLLPFVKNELDEGRRSLRSLFHHPEVTVLRWSKEDEAEAMNLNTQDEFDQAECWVQSRDLTPPVTFRRAELIKLA